MSDLQRNSMGGGVLILAGGVVGIAVGVYLHEVTPGFLIGAGVGIAAAALVWLVDRRR